MSAVVSSSTESVRTGKKKKRTGGGVSFGGGGNHDVSSSSSSPRKSRGISFSGDGDDVNAAEEQGGVGFTSLDKVQIYVEEPSIEEDLSENDGDEDLIVAKTAPMGAKGAAVDPKLVLAATLFVQELVKSAQAEADKRRKDEEEAAQQQEDDPLLGQGGAAGHFSSGGPDHLTDKNIRFIREEINKKCRRMYQAFLSCYGKLP